MSSTKHELALGFKKRSESQMTGYYRSSVHLQPASNSFSLLTDGRPTNTIAAAGTSRTAERGLQVRHPRLLPELRALPGLPELPALADSIPRHNCPAVAGRDSERQRSADFHSHRPQSAPVAVHVVPARGRSLDPHRLDITCSAYVVDQHHQEPRVASNREPDSTALHATHPSKSQTKS